MSNNYKDLIRDINNKKANQTFAIRTYGCQMNEHDSEYVRQIFLDMGFIEIDELEYADTIMINTCAIRETAEDKAFGYIGSLKSIKEKYPEKTIIVSGCMPKVESSLEEFKRVYHHLDILMGTGNYDKLPELLYRSYNTDKTIIDTEDSEDLGSTEVDYHRDYKHKSFVNITYGCNNFCTYCIVPYTRGRERSRELGEIVSEVQSLVKDGVKEITLLGQNVNSYGKHLSEPKTFVDLLEELDKVPGLERIRFMTSHPKDISDELLESFKTLDKLSPHLHLPVQSGSDQILKEMNRNYTAKEYISKIDKVKSICPEITLSTDIIVGFPGETEEDFDQTLELIKKVEYDFIFSFLYSPREGTGAAKRTDQIDADIKQARLESLMELSNEISKSLNEKLIGTYQNVLIDEISSRGEGYVVGRTDGFKLVTMKGDQSMVGKIVKVKITDSTAFALEGELCE